MKIRWPPQCRFSPKDTSEVSILEYELNAGCRARLNHSHSLSACFGGWSQHQPGELRENVHSKLHSKQLMVYYYRPRHCIMGNVPKKSQVRFAPLDLLEAWVSLCKSIHHHSACHFYPLMKHFYPDGGGLFQDVSSPPRLHLQSTTAHWMVSWGWK